MKKKLFFAAAAVVLTVVLVCGIYVINVYRIKKLGVTLTPSKDYPIKTTNYYLQNDPRWAAEPIGNSNSSLGGKGCLVSCVATAITDLGTAKTPQEVNQMLTQADGFLGADLIWYKINEVFPQVDYKYSRVFTSRTIEQDLAAGLLPIVNVKYHKTGVTHWVLVAGAKDGEFYVLDSMKKDMAPLPLSDHGKVYAYRVLYRSDKK